MDLYPCEYKVYNDDVIFFFFFLFYSFNVIQKKIINRWLVLIIVSIEHLCTATEREREWQPWTYYEKKKYVYRKERIRTVIVMSLKIKWRSRDLLNICAYMYNRNTPYRERRWHQRNQKWHKRSTFYLNDKY